MNRRQFTAAALSASATAAWAAKIDSKIHGVKIGVQSYSFRTMTMEEAIAAMTKIGIGEVELFASHAERFAGAPQVPPPPASASGEAKKGGGFRMPPGFRDEVRKWRLSVGMDKFKEVRQKFTDAGINLHAYNLSFRQDFTDEEIDRGFEMAKALGVKVITASSTVSMAKRVAPFATKHKITVSMHGHSNLKDPEEFAKPESFAAAMATSKYIGVNLDIGHFTAAGFDPIAYIKENHARITNLHLKDRKKNDGPNTIWGEGETPIKEVLQLLKKEKYPIPADIEYEYRGASDPTTEVKKCFEYCRAALA
jgi:sugar phosphate isomerase/epimerase